MTAVTVKAVSIPSAGNKKGRRGRKSRIDTVRRAIKKAAVAVKAVSIPPAAQ